MSGGAVGRRYARAIIQLADAEGGVDRIGRELDSVEQAFAASSDLREAFENPAVGSAGRKGVLEAISTRLGLSKTVRNTLQLLADRRRMRYLSEIVESYRVLAEERAGRVRAEVVTAVALPEPYYAELQQALEAVTGKRVTLVRKQDPSIIGGVVARVGDKVFDGSVKNRLAELKEELLAS